MTRLTDALSRLVRRPSVETARVVARVEMIPTVVLEACTCGRDHRTDDRRAVALIRQRQDLVVKCSCGKTNIGCAQIIH